MDSNWNAVQSGAATGASFGVGPDSNANLDWRSQMQPDARQRVVNKMVDTLNSHLPVLVPERLSEFQKIAVRFEEQIYSFSTSQPDYLKRIALKMFSIERETQPGLNPSLPKQNQIDPGVGMTSQQPSLNPGESLGMPQVMNRTPASRQQQQQPLLQGLPNMPQQQQSQPMIQNSTMRMQQNNVTDLQQQRLQMQKNKMQKNQLQPNQMQQNQMLTQQMIIGQQRNLLLGSGGASNVDNMQRQMKMQRNAGWQQQPQQQQHLLSHQLQSQQQQLPRQQQPSMMQQREMQMPQQCMQGSPVLLQTQNGNAIDPQRQQQQQLQQQQRVVQNVASSPASMDSAAQTRHQGDWQEEIYQRITYLKDTYFTDLREVHQKLSIKLSQLDSIVLPDARGGEQIQKMKHYKMVLERMMAGLQLSKKSMGIGLKDKLSVYEEQIVSILQNHKKAPQQQPQAGAPSDQPHFPALQQSQPGLQSQQLPQQQQSQQMDNQNQLQQQLSTRAMPQPNNLRMPNDMQQGMHNTLHLDQLQASGMGFGSLQQGSMGPTMQNTMNPHQMVGSGAAISSSIMSHTVTKAGMQTNTSCAQVLKPEQQHQEQQIQLPQRMMRTQQQTQQRYLQQHLMQQNQQNQMQQLSESSDPADLKSWQGASVMKPGSMFQQDYPGMGLRNGYNHSQLKPGSNPLISSPHNIHSYSPQISPPSPQVDQQGLIPPTQLKSGTPLQAAASPFVPSPSPSVVPSPMIEDTKLGAGLMHNSASGQTGKPLPANSAQTGQIGQPQEESLAFGTPGISASQLPAEFTSPEAGILSIQVPESETPIQKLARLMRTMPHNQLNSAVKDIASVVSMVDRIPGSALGNGSQAAIDDDLVAMAKCQLQAENLAYPEGVGGTSGRASPSTNKRKRDSIAREVIQEYADQLGGGSFFSKIIKWQAVNPADPYVIV